MSVALGLPLALLQLALMLAVAPLLAGAAASLRARFGGRAGQGVLQPWREMVRLLRKEPVLPADASALFRSAPAVALAAAVAAAILVPAFTLESAGRPLADLLVLAGLSGLSRASLVLAGLEAGTALGGLAASRLTALAVLTTPGLLTAVFAFALLGGGSNLFAILAALGGGDGIAHVAALLAFLALLPAAFAATGRGPVADPAARHETGLLGGAAAFAYSGRHLALLRAAAALELVLWLSLLGNLLLPFGLADARSAPLAWLLALPVWGLKLAGGTALLAAWEARGSAPRREWLASACALGALAGLAAVLLLCCSGQGGV